MAQIMALLMALVVAVGAADSGRDLIDTIVRMAQVATEKMTLNQIGKSIWMHNIEKGHKLAYNELPAFVKANVTAGGRDVSRDIWGTAYYIENDKWRGMVFKEGGDEFIVCSAGPDQKWWDVDDELWYNFDMPEELLFKAKPKPGDKSEIDSVLAKLDAFRAKTTEGIAKLSKSIGATGLVTTTSLDNTPTAAPTSGPQ